MQAPQGLVAGEVLLRRWRAEDLETFAAYNADPRVMAYFPAVLGRDDSDALARRIIADFEDREFGLWAVEIPGLIPFAGFVGLDVPRFEAPFMPAIELGWRLGCAAWGHGWARRAAVATLEDAFGRLGLAEVVAFTAATNRRSIRLMERLGMVRDDVFDHPDLDPSDALAPHVLYRLAATDHRPAWSTKEGVGQ